MLKCTSSLIGLILIGVASSCGPSNNNLAPEENNIQNKYFSNPLGEFGRCNDTQDNDGDGLRDSQDPDCHGPRNLRDLSTFRNPTGHNYRTFAYNHRAGFRNQQNHAQWLRFLTEPHGFTAGIDLYTNGVNPGVVAYPKPNYPVVRQGSYAQGNNYNLSQRKLHHKFLDHDMPELNDAPGLGSYRAHRRALTGKRYDPPYYGYPVGRWGGWPGGFYQAQGPNI